MEQAFLVMRLVHIGAGVITLLVGLGSIITRKGSRWHRRWGKIFFWAMVIVTLTASLMAIYRLDIAFMLISLFSFYAAFLGYRVLYRKSRRGEQHATALDWGFALLALAGSLGMFVYGLVGLLMGASAGIILIVFGVIGCGMAGSDIRKLRQPATDRNAWWYDHMFYMLGAYIAALSAVSVTNFNFLPDIIRWLWPTVLGVPGIILWQRYYRQKFARSGSRDAETHLDPRLHRVGERQAGTQVQRQMNQSKP